MRGARIAEKIQEFYHTTGSSVLPSSSSSKNQILFNKTAGTTDLAGIPTNTSSSQNPKSRANLMSQGGSRASGASKLMYQSETTNASAQGGPGSKPRATSAYGNSSRRNLPHTQNNFIVQNMGTHQKVLIDNMKDQKNQLRKIDGQQPNSQNNSNFAATILGLPSGSDQHVLSGEMNNSIGVIGLSQ